MRAVNRIGGLFVLMLVVLLCFTSCSSKDTVDELVERGENSFAKGDYDNAAESFSKAYDKKGLFTSDAEKGILLNLGYTYEAKGDYKQAISAYSKLIKKEKKSVIAYNQRGFCYMQLEQYEKAKADLTKADKFDKNSALTLLNMCYLALAMDDKTQWQELLDRAEELKPGSEQELSYQGKMFLLSNEFEKALACFEGAYEGDNTLVNTRIGVAKCYAGLDRPDLAEEYLLNYLKLQPDDTEAMNELGVVYLRTDKPQKALDLFNQCMKTDGFTKRLRYNQITAHERLADFDKAYGLLVDYVEDYPNDEDAKRELEFVKTRM